MRTRSLKAKYAIFQMNIEIQVLIFLVVYEEFLSEDRIITKKSEVNLVPCHS